MTDTNTAQLAGTYTIDPSHSRLGFSVRHAMVAKVRGSFQDFEGTATIDTDNPANSSVNLTAQIDSIVTGSADRDAHLRTSDFFDVENNPTMTFTSTKVERDDDEWIITGDLSIKGVSNSVSIEFEEQGLAQDPFGNVRAGFDGEATINRKDWGLTYNASLETGGVLIGDKIKLELDISAIQG